jgi:hypothetical protein
MYKKDYNRISTWEKNAYQIPTIRKIVNSLPLSGTFNEFACDVFHRLVSGDKNLKPDDNHYHWDKKIHDAFSDSLLWEQLAVQCENDPRLSIVAAAWIAKGCSEKIASSISSLTIFKDAIDKVKADRRRYDGYLKNIVHTHLFPSNWVKEILTNTESALNPIADDSSGSATSLSSMPMGSVARGLREKVEVSMTYSHERMRHILAQLGRMQASIGNKSKQTVLIPSQQHAYGNQIENLLIDEFFKDDFQFCLDFAEQKLLQTSKKKMPVQQGAIIVALDQSYSMNADIENGGYSAPPEKEIDIWAKAFLMMVFQHALKQKRDVYCLGFGGHVIYKINLNTMNNKEFEQVFLARPDEGSTEWVPVLLESLEIIEKNPQYKNADILLITDGVDYVNDFYAQEIKTRKNAVKAKIHGIMINKKDNSQRMLVVCDEVTAIASIEDESKLGNVLSQL